MNGKLFPLGMLSPDLTQGGNGPEVGLETIMTGVFAVFAKVFE